MPLSYDWDGEALLLATPADSPTGRNLAATRAVRLALGHTRDVTMIDGDVEVLEIDALPRELGDRFSARTGFDPRTLSTPYRWYRVTPRHVQAWREANELPDRADARRPLVGLTTPSSHPRRTAMTSIESITLEVADPTAADRFYTAAFGLDTQMRLRASEAPTTGFRGFTLSLMVSQPATVNALIDAALDAGATPLKPAAKSLWGYGGVVQAPDGTIWKVATSAKKDTGPATRQIDEIVLLLGVADVAASKRFYVDRGLAVAKSFGRKYVEFATPVESRQAGALRAPRPRQGRRRLSRRHRIAPARHRQRRRALHRPGRVRVGDRVAASRTEDALIAWPGAIVGGS